MSSADEWVIAPGSRLTDEQYQSLKDGTLYVNVHSTAHTEGKAAYLKGLRAGRVRFIGVTRRDTRVRAWGDVALLDSKATLDFEMGGERRSANSNVVSAWVRRDGRWRMAHYHSTTIPRK